MRMTLVFLLAAALALTGAAELRADGVRHIPAGNPNYTPAPPKEGYSYPDCYCTDSDGKRVEMGQRACLRIGSRRFTARCDMSVNNPIWRQETEGCPGV